MVAFSQALPLIQQFWNNHTVYTPLLWVHLAKAASSMLVKTMEILKYMYIYLTLQIQTLVWGNLQWDWMLVQIERAWKTEVHRFGTNRVSTTSRATFDWPTYAQLPSCCIAQLHNSCSIPAMNSYSNSIPVDVHIISTMDGKLWFGSSTTQIAIYRSGYQHQ